LDPTCIKFGDSATFQFNFLNNSYRISSCDQLSLTYTKGPSIIGDCSRMQVDYVKFRKNYKINITRYQLGNKIRFIALNREGHNMPWARLHLHSAWYRPSTPPSLPGLLARTCMGTFPHWEPMWQYPVT
jgi:hypothetical protein